MIDNRADSARLRGIAALTDNSRGVQQLQAWARRIGDGAGATTQSRSATGLERGGETGTGFAPGAHAAPVQREILPFATRDANDPAVLTWTAAVANFVGQVNTWVTQARALSCNWRDLTPDGGYLGQWINTAQAFFQDSKVVPPFVHARFGYAVETLACRNLPNTFQGLTVHTQYASGATRPDIVLTNGFEEIAWIDITAQASRFHIQGKDGGGWKTRPFVYEILYDSLNLNEILGGRDAPVLEEVGAYYAARSQISAEESEAQRLRAGAVLIALREEKGWITGIGDSDEKRRATKARVEAQLHINLGASWVQNLKGLFSWAEVSDGPYGFNTYYGGQNANVAKQWGKTQADPVIAGRQAALNTEKLEDVQSVLDESEDYDYLPFALHYKQNVFANDTARIAAALAVMAAAPYVPELQEAAQRLGEHDVGFDDLAEFKEEVDRLLVDVPQEADVDELNSWVNSAMPLIRATPAMIKAHTAVRRIGHIAEHFEGEPDRRAQALLQRIHALERFPATRDPVALDEWADETEGLPEDALLLRDALQAQQALLQYLNQKYGGGLNFFARTPLENILLQNVGADTVNSQAVHAARQYINLHPLPPPPIQQAGGPGNQAQQPQSNAMDTS